MPEPGFNDFDFDGPMNNSPRRKVRAGPAGKRLKARLKLPREFANFRLKDGRRFGDVMGDDVFEPMAVSDGGEPLQIDREQMAYESLTQSASEIEEAAAPHEQVSPVLERSRATGMSPPPFEMIPPLPRIQARRDDAGDWWHGASRGGGTRHHNGVDLLAEPGTPVRSPLDGTVHRINFTTSGMATITLRNNDGQEVKLLYVAPVDGRGNRLLTPGASVQAGQIIGTVEDLGEGYGDARTGRMKNHVHMRVSENGEPVDPLPWLAQWWTNPEGSGKNRHPRWHSAAPGTGSAPDYDAVGEGHRLRREREQR